MASSSYGRRRTGRRSFRYVAIRRHGLAGVNVRMRKEFESMCCGVQGLAGGALVGLCFEDEGGTALRGFCEWLGLRERPSLSRGGPSFGPRPRQIVLRPACSHSLIHSRSLSQKPRRAALSLLCRAGQWHVGGICCGDTCGWNAGSHAGVCFACGWWWGNRNESDLPGAASDLELGVARGL